MTRSSAARPGRSLSNSVGHGGTHYTGLSLAVLRDAGTLKDPCHTHYSRKLWNAEPSHRIQRGSLMNLCITWALLPRLQSASIRWPFAKHVFCFAKLLCETVSGCFLIEKHNSNEYVEGLEGQHCARSIERPAEIPTAKRRRQPQSNLQSPIANRTPQNPNR